MNNLFQSIGKYLGGAILLWIGMLPALGLAGESYAVVVNKDNSFSGTLNEMEHIVARMFLKQQTRWPNDLSSRPFDRTLESSEHQVFVAHVLKLSERNLAEHWGKMKQLRGDTPPRSIRSPRVLLRLIEKNKGGFGVIKTENVGELPEGVRILFSFSSVELE